jgi:hypothetical protein
MSTAKSQQRNGTEVLSAAKTTRGRKQRWQSKVQNASNKNICDRFKMKPLKKSDYRTKKTIKVTMK